MVLVHDHGNVRVRFDGRQHQVTQIRFARVFACTGRCLQNHRAVGFLRSLHDGLDLLQVVDIECRYAITVFGSVVQYLAQ